MLGLPRKTLARARAPGQLVWGHRHGGEQRDRRSRAHDRQQAEMLPLDAPRCHITSQLERGSRFSGARRMWRRCCATPTSTGYRCQRPRFPGRPFLRHPPRRLVEKLVNESLIRLPSSPRHCPQPCNQARIESDRDELLSASGLRSSDTLRPAKLCVGGFRNVREVNPAVGHMPCALYGSTGGR